MNSTPERILVFRIGHLGDTIVTLPAFWSIREAFPDSHISLLSNADAKNEQYVAARSVLPEEGLFDDWIVYANSAGAFGAAKAFSGLLRTLRTNKYDTVYYLMTRNRSAGRISRDRMFFRTAGIKEIVGEKFLLNNLLNPEVGHPLPTITREADFFLEMIADSGIAASGRGSDLAFTQSEVEAADAWLGENIEGDCREKRIVAVAPGSKWLSKVWFEDRYIEVLRKLLDSHDVMPVIFGGPEDHEKGAEILNKVGRGANAAGALDIRTAAAAMRHARLYLGNDTGTMHMAAAVNVPCVAIFAAIDFPGRWYPFGDGHKVFRVAVECEGCHTPDCFNSHACLESVSTLDVYEACVGALQARAG